MADDFLSALRDTANRWALRARDYARDAKAETDPTKAALNRGYAEGYYKAATELAALLKDETARSARSLSDLAGASPPPAASASPVESPAQAAVTYAPVSVGEVLTMLNYAGIDPRDIEQRKDNSFRAVFSRWQNIMDHERIEIIKKSDLRIVILNSGKLRDTHDAFVEFAFRET
jgi:hypothetical protein